jgi:hypothetical protein
LKYWQGQEIFSLPLCPHWLLGLPMFLFSGHKAALVWVKAAKGLKLTTYLHEVLSLRMHGAVLPLPHMFLHGMYSDRFILCSSFIIIIKLIGKSVPMMQLFYLKVNKSFYDYSSLHVSAAVCFRQLCVM